MATRHTVGDVVTSRVDNGKIKVGDVGIVVHFANYPGEEYPWTVETEDGRKEAFNGFELAKENEDV